MAPFRINIRLWLSEGFTEVDVSQMMEDLCRKDYGHYQMKERSTKDNSLHPMKERSRKSKRRHIRMWYKTCTAPDDTSEFTLEVFEENLVVLRDIQKDLIYCGHCSYAGWGTHPLCSNRYHIIICNNPNSNGVSGLKRNSKPQDLVGEDASHLLHGVIHSNGFGHLIRINGREGGSLILKGSDLMGFWDETCAMLGVSKVSVVDASRKYGIEYRLLHLISHGQQWYGKWGYEFGRGSFGLRREAFEKALHTLSTQSISSIFSSRSSSRGTKLQNMIASYQFLSNNSLSTVQDLFIYLSSLLVSNWGHKAKSLVQKQLPVNPFHWTEKETKDCTSEILRILQDSATEQWVSCSSLRSATRRASSSPEKATVGLIDYCLEHLAGKTQGGKFVVTRKNIQNAAEYRLEAPQNCHIGSNPLPRREDIITDLVFLYNELLDPENMQSYEPKTKLEAARFAARSLLNSKILLKNYNSQCNTALSDSSVQMKCYLEINHQFGDSVCPPELITLPEAATVSVLKDEVTKVFKETYLSFDGVQACLADFWEVRENIEVKQLLGSQGVAHFDGGHIGNYEKEQPEENGEVNCICGANYDDGEIMIQCKTCKKWKHRMCSFGDDEDVPKQYVCSLCDSTKRK